MTLQRIRQTQHVKMQSQFLHWLDSNAHFKKLNINYLCLTPLALPQLVGGMNGNIGYTPISKSGRRKSSQIPTNLAPFMPDPLD
jgi:hypothetical protein